MRVFAQIALLLVGLVAAPLASAQQGSVTVPNVVGLNVPQAAAELNRAGLRLGAETALGWTPDSGLPQNSVSAQSVEAGSEVAFGTAVDLTVLRSANAVLIYDDNDITLVNQSGGALQAGGIVFNSLDGNTPAAFSGSRWSPSLLDAGDCAQLWSVGRTGPKDVPECAQSTIWLTTNDPGQHFWTGTNGATQFDVVQDGIRRAVCTISVTGRCEFFLASSGAGEVLPYVYIAYTTDRWVIYNNSTDQFMSLDDILFGNSPSAAGGEVAPASASDNPDQVVGNVLLLAPQQCLYVRDAAVSEGPPVPCEVIALYTLPPGAVYWNANLYMRSVSDRVQRICPPATEGRLTICILPR